MFGAVHGRMGQLVIQVSIFNAQTNGFRPMVKRIDPGFARSILVNTKFDNRVKELRDPESANKVRSVMGFFLIEPLVLRR